MALELIPNQQFIFNVAESLCCITDRRYCQLLNNNDTVNIQLKQTPCAAQFLCEPSFYAGTSENNAPDGSFATDPVAAGWTLNSNWTWNGGTFKINKTNGNTNTCFVTGTPGLTSGYLYQVTYTLTVNLAGSITVSIGGTAGTARSASGTYIEYIVAGGDGLIKFTPDMNIDCDIDDVSCHLVSECWTYSNNDFTIDDVDGVCHETGNITTIGQNGIFGNTNYYKIEFEIYGRTQGSVTIGIGANTTGAVEANGIQSYYLYADGTDLLITMSADFDGCIRYINAFLLVDTVQFYLYDLDGNQVADLTAQGFIFIDDEYITLTINFENGVLESGEGFVPYGCYYIYFVDDCTEVAIEYASNCLSWQEEWECAKRFIGTCENTNSLGFNFTNFTLYNRLLLSIVNPTYTSDKSDYLFSEGTRSIVAVISEKYYTLLFNAVDEATHDNINALINCTQLTIDTVPYFVKKGDYKPEWDRRGESLLAESSVEAKKVTDTIFNLGCQ
jgi:hypothetical protein